MYIIIVPFICFICSIIMNLFLYGTKLIVEYCKDYIILKNIYYITTIIFIYMFLIKYIIVYEIIIL